jgi:hypothetical protein
MMAKVLAKILRIFDRYANRLRLSNKSFNDKGISYDEWMAQPWALGRVYVPMRTTQYERRGRWNRFICKVKCRARAWAWHLEQKGIEQ